MLGVEKPEKALAFYFIEMLRDCHAMESALACDGIHVLVIPHIRAW
jgi:hypothetical protein